MELCSQMLQENGENNSKIIKITLIFVGNQQRGWNHEDGYDQSDTVNVCAIVNVYLNTMTSGAYMLRRQFGTY